MQDILALLIVVLAGAYLVRRGWQRIVRRSAGGCHSCSACSTGAGSSPLVSLSPRYSQGQPGGRRASSK
jgi:hypothetical protein